MKNATKIIAGVIYVVLAVLIIRFVHPVGYIVGTLADWSYHFMSSEGLGWVKDTNEWGTDNVSLAVSIFAVLIIAWLLSVLVNIIKKVLRL
ncbi:MULTISPECIES: hypothetical protein [Serratia]|uniref:hypothetical protein n=1 Tax=Serratia TaxID=613 RepID=UPI001E3DA066|nr:hypothetical protein [Serratia marcescens]EGT3596294.1 hypothetical protein [Serratia marcescens]MDP8626443.1 hypothetical protein [Serratia marcescens]MDP8675877.1 hypothetical protein [Serratia marcescens]MDP8690880.1 hypothetical protein [Serratia marcescens]MDP8700538.1 hypothetical protein [Serratia marcescens]